MGTNGDEQIRLVHERWDKAVKERKLEALMALYSEEAIFEGYAVFVLFPDRKEGILRGKEEVTSLFEESFRRQDWGMWWRSGEYCSNQHCLIWEYPRSAPSGTQLDLTEVMDIEDGLIVRHRVYWGWESIKALIDKSRG